MGVVKFALSEIRHRPAGFLIGCGTVALATALALTILVSLDRHNSRAAQALAAKENETRKRVDGMVETYRTIAREMGYTLLIVPRGQELGDLYADGYSAQTMPEESADRLAAAGATAFDRLLPSLRQKRQWPEFKQTVLIDGVGEEIATGDSRGALKPMAPESGMVDLGYELHWGHRITPGDTVRIMGTKFAVRECRDQQGSAEDISIRMSLAQAQELLDMRGRISEIRAGESLMDDDRMAQGNRQLATALPEAKLIDVAAESSTRVRSIKGAMLSARGSLDRERASHTALTRKRHLMALSLLAFIAAGCAAIAGLLALTNARERREEVAILRALGVPTPAVLAMFTVRSCLAGAAGALAGAVIALGVALLPGSGGAARTVGEYLLLLAATAAAGVVVTGIGALAPALGAASRDPADILGKE